ncbi:glycosyltransferase family 10 domain-containing protein [Yersinia intermedia]|uniref:Glycosyltransferase family 10 (Fucosyltransferase) n=1 Tax=Yersinia intermedia TaxID=631 RepID=A0A0T9M5L8_YERIN|nr:glycosyltransferase family 10 [Yersinia intermedia]MCB5297639.1 glycosyltransferase family 10 [Yersinia intermedia]CNF65293.1 Glycosyltransferase family 10 (fucosyltransferase) [Yersinia intermedia]CNJ77252.1 Glycosyltransferase family 10 (fucosyltransferase) [Yersinia intermedia]
MKISLCINYHLNNKIFMLNDVEANRDNCQFPYYMLKERLGTHGVSISTCDILLPKDADLSFYFDYESDVYGFSKNNYLFLFESDLIKPLGWRLDVQNKFDKIFTWDDSLVDDSKFFKINFTQLFPNKDELDIIFKPFSEKKLCTLISGNKKIRHPNELYSERVKIIKWFERYHPSDFDFYGVGWDKPVTHSKYVNFILKRFKFTNSFFYTYKTYKGKVENKKDTLRDYKFAVCFENAKNLKGYITEKIFDCFFSGVIPIYWGAYNIADYIPKECFIDYRDFNCYEDLYVYIKEMHEFDYNFYIDNIVKFLLSDKSYPFNEKFLSDVIIRHVLNDIEK